MPGSEEKDIMKPEGHHIIIHFSEDEKVRIYETNEVLKRELTVEDPSNSREYAGKRLDDIHLKADIYQLTGVAEVSLDESSLRVTVGSGENWEAINDRIKLRIREHQRWTGRVSSEHRYPKRLFAARA